MDLTDDKTKQQLTSILTDAIVALCKNTLSFDQQLNIDGLLGISTDGNAHLMVHIKHSQRKPVSFNSEPEDEVQRDSSRPRTKKTRKRRRRSSNSSSEVEMSRNREIELNNHASPLRTDSQVKAEVVSDDEDDNDDVQLVDPVKAAESGVFVKQPNDAFHTGNGLQTVTPETPSASAMDESSLYLSEGDFASLPPGGNNINSREILFPDGNYSMSEMSAALLKFTCPTCNKQLGSMSALSRHMKGHQGGSVQCPQCGKGFNRKDNLKRHYDKQHLSRSGLDTALGQVLSLYSETMQENGAPNNVDTASSQDDLSLSENVNTS